MRCQFKVCCTEGSHIPVERAAAGQPERIPVKIQHTRHALHNWRCRSSSLDYVPSSARDSQHWRQYIDATFATSLTLGPHIPQTNDSIASTSAQHVWIDWVPSDCFDCARVISQDVQCFGRG